MRPLLAGFALLLLCGAGRPGQVEETYRATVRFPNGTTDQVTGSGKDFYDARKRMEQQYCMGSRSCIIEGPWRVP